MANRERGDERPAGRLRAGRDAVRHPTRFGSPSPSSVQTRRTRIRQRRYPGRVAVDKRILFGSLGAAAIISVAGGWALSSRNDSARVAADDDVTLTSTGVYLEPGIAVNDPVQGEPLPAVDLRDNAGAEVSTSSLVGKPLVINVWGTDCVACRTEMPALAKVSEEYGDKVRFVGVNVAANTGSALSFAKDKGVQYQLLSDQDGNLVTTLGIKGIPYTLFVAADGTIVVQKGIELDAATIRATINDNLLS